MICKTPFNTPSQQATIPAGETVQVDLPTEGDRHFAVYRLSIGSDAIEDLFIEEVSLPGKQMFLGGDFPSLTGDPDGRVHLSLLANFFRRTQLHRPIIIEPNRPLRLRVTNLSGDTEHTVTFAPLGVHLDGIPAGYVPPMFLHAHAEIDAEASAERVLIPPEPEALVFDRYLLAADEPADVTLNVLVAGVPVREYAFLEQINDEFEHFRLPLPHAVPANGQVILELSNANAEAQHVSILAEVWTPNNPPGTHPLDAPSYAHVVGPVLGWGGGPAQTEPSRTKPGTTKPGASDPERPTTPPAQAETLPCPPGQRCAAPGWQDPGTIKQTTGGAVKPQTGNGLPWNPSSGLDCLVPPCPGDGYPFQAEIAQAEIAQAGSVKPTSVLTDPQRGNVKPVLQQADLQSAGAVFGFDWLKQRL